MAVAFDAASNGGGNGTSITVSHTCTGTDLCLVVFAAVDAASDFGPAASYDGVSMGALVTEVTTGRYQAVFVLANPSTGTHDIVVSSLPGGGRQHVLAASFTGVDQSTPNDTPVTASSAAGANTTATVSSATGDMVVDGVAVNLSTAPTADASQTTPANGTLDNAAMSGAISYEAGAASVAMDWTHVATAVSQIALNLNAAAAGGGSILPLAAVDMANMADMKDMRG